MSRHRKRLPAEPVTANIESLSHEGRGIAHINGKTVFVDRTLPGEDVMFKYRKIHSRFDEGQLIDVINSSPERINPRCMHFGICGGCSLQHISTTSQVSHKQIVLLEQLQHIGGISPARILPPVYGNPWGYRRRARLGVKYVEKKAKVLVGFREWYSSYLADLSHCEILHPSIGMILEDLQDLIKQLSIFRKVPQIEIAVADRITAMTIRHLDDFTADDIELLKAFESNHPVVIYLQSSGPGSVTSLSPPEKKELSYRIPDHDIDIHFKPVDFIQNNHEINLALINLVLELLSLNANDVVLDLFCGLGNFSLPLARKVKKVYGIEGKASLVERAKENARFNGIENTDFQCADLALDNLQANFLKRDFNKILLDPPRDGASVIIQQIKHKEIENIVYVSCNPATFARDAGILVRDKGYILQKIGIIDMFPHTAHMEIIALFIR